MSINLVQATRHSDISGNYKADHANNGTMVTDTSFNKHFGISFAKCKLLFKGDIIAAITGHWLGARSTDEPDIVS